MKKFIETLKNIWKVEELKKRILFTLLLLLVYRFGAHIFLPGVDVAAVKAASSGQSGSNDLIGLINAFTGGAFKNASIFALGVMPYITASIIVQLLGFALPYFQKLQKTEGESGRNKLNQITRFLTVAITLVQGTGYIIYLHNQDLIGNNVSLQVFRITNSILLSAGALFAMWLGEKITDNGIGNGISILIMVGIMSRFPSAAIFEFTDKFNGIGGPLVLVVEMLALIAVILAAVLVVQGVRRIPIQFAKRMVGRSSMNMPVQGNRDFIPLKVNSSGVMPIIFAQALMFIPATLGSLPFLFGPDAGTSNFVRVMKDFTTWQYNLVYFLLIVLFTYVYTALMVNPTQYADYLKRQNAFIPGIKPGKSTADFIDKITSRITLPGSIMLGLIAILPAFAAGLGVNTGFALFFGGTSLIILVGVVLDTLQQIESYLLMKKYDGLVKDGKIKGRSGGSKMQPIGAGM